MPPRNIQGEKKTGGRKAGAHGWREAHSGAGSGEPLSFPGSKKQGLWGKEKGCVFQRSKLGVYASCFVLQREEGKTTSPTLAMKVKAYSRPLERKRTFRSCVLEAPVATEVLSSHEGQTRPSVSVGAKHQ